MIRMLGIVLMLSGCASSYYKPTRTTEFDNTTVKIFKADYRSGGSGVIYRSSNNGSTILTNSHVCELVANGGFVVYKGNEYPTHTLKKYPYHDLCLIKVMHNFHINTKIAKKMPKIFDTVAVPGHPQLMPLIVSRGHLSGFEVIQLSTGNGRQLKEFFSQSMSALIQPGSSGSAVFNKKGEIVGLVFASNSYGMSYGFIVPHTHLKNFIITKHRYKWEKARRGKTGTTAFDLIFKFERYCEKYGICGDIKFRQIWVK